MNKKIRIIGSVLLTIIGVFISVITLNEKEEIALKRRKKKTCAIK